MITHVRSKWWKRKRGRRKETLPAMRTASRSVKKRGNQPTARREKRKGSRKLWEKKAIHAHFQRKKRKGGHQLRKVVQVRPAGGMYPEQKIAGRKLHEGFGCVLWTYYLGSSRLVISIFLRLVNNLFVRDLWSEHYWATMASCAL